MDVQKLTQALAGTQCTQCGYPSCAAYANAIAAGDAITKCRPGGAQVVAALAALTGQPIQPPAQPPLPAHVLVVDETACIGCTKCLQVCPTDAIIGAPKQMHTVLPERCTGCDVCVPVCPVACLHPVPTPVAHAQSAVWEWVYTKQRRQSAELQRGLAAVASQVPASPPAPLPPEVQAKIHAARAQSQAKYAHKQLAPPKELRDKS